MSWLIYLNGTATLKASEPEMQALTKPIQGFRFLQDWWAEVILFDLILYIPSNIFQLNRVGSSCVDPVLSQDKCVFLKEHNAVTPVRLEPAASPSRVKHSTTEPLRSLGPK